MSEDIQDLKPSALGRREHNVDASAKRVVIRYQDPASGAWTNFVPDNFSWDYLSYTNTSSTVDTYTFKTGGSGGTTVKTITITYTDSTKSVIDHVART